MNGFHTLSYCYYLKIAEIVLRNLDINLHMKYRAEIEGIRALAVLPVILFHAGFEWFSGGFIGVDVFFVISVYLITTIIISDMAKGKFSIVNF